MPVVFFEALELENLRKRSAVFVRKKGLGCGLPGGTVLCGVEAVVLLTQLRQVLLQRLIEERTAPIMLHCILFQQSLPLLTANVDLALSLVGVPGGVALVGRGVLGTGSPDDGEPDGLSKLNF